MTNQLEQLVFEKMAALPSPTQVAGNSNAIYEAYYNVVDPNGFGSVGGMEAARFLKKSGLSDVILSKIWDLSDPGGRGCLDKAGMFVALKLVALVQNGKDLSISNVTIDVPPPKMGDITIPKPTKPPPPRNNPLISSLPPTAVDWTIKPAESEKYEKLFDSLQPLNGLIPGNKVKNVLLESKLPFETLGKVWDLADQDKDGMLNRHEFVVINQATQLPIVPRTTEATHRIEGEYQSYEKKRAAFRLLFEELMDNLHLLGLYYPGAMHLVYKALEKYAIPNTLPPELMDSVKRKGSPPHSLTLINQNVDGIKEAPPSLNIQPVVSVTPIKTTQSLQPSISWVVTTEEKAKSDTLFIKSDIDKDGFVSGQEIKDVFLQSGVPQPVLAHIWALCDIKQSGKLNNEQFALAMWLVARCLKGIEPPVTLTPEMIPPSFRPSKIADGIVENNNIRYSNPELDMITKDIEELSKEKMSLETEIAQKEADIKIKNGEIKSLQSELDTLVATLKQLENQKGEAQKRLNDLQAQNAEINGKFKDHKDPQEKQTQKVDKLRIQAAEQAELVKIQEVELNSKREQLESLRHEEERLEEQKAESMKKLDDLTLNLQDTQFCISQAKAVITQLQEQTRQMNDAISSCDTAVELGDVTQVPDAALSIKPEFRDPDYNKVLMVNGNISKDNIFEADPFSNTNETLNQADNTFCNDPFKNDPFKNKDAFSNIPFKAFSEFNDGFTSDPFEESFSSTIGQADTFNAFGDSQKLSEATEEPIKDPFGCDPFAILHAPTRDSSVPPRPTSPSPALPPKKSKQPPPRPAPPRPSQPPVVKNNTQSDAFGSDIFESSGGFADFSDFETKFTNKPTAKVQVQPVKGLDFTDDPFRDYRYEDLCNISFDDEPPTDEKKSTTSTPADAFSSIHFNTKDNFDPFGLDGRQSVPLPNSAPFVSVSGRASAPVSSELLSEDQQLAWAACESLKLEEERKKRQLQEEADFELAISLSKAES